MSEEQNDFKLTNSRKKKSILTSLREASATPFLMSQEEDRVNKEKEERKRSKIEKETSDDFPVESNDDIRWIDSFVDLKISGGKHRYGSNYVLGEDGYEKKKKKKGKNGLTDYEKKFATEERLLSGLLADQMNLTSTLQKQYDHMMGTKATSAGVSKFTTDFIEGLNQARNLAMQLVDKKIAIKKTIADLSMKERKEFGSKNDESAKDLSAHTASLLHQILGNRKEFIQSGPTAESEEYASTYDDIDQFPDIDGLMEEHLGDTKASDESDAYLKYENAGVKIRIVYRGENNDPYDYDFIAEDRNGNELDDYPLPIKTPLSINRSTGFATDSYGERYPVTFE